MRKMILIAALLVALPATAASPLPWLALTEQQAARFREQTAGDANRLEPRLGEAGPCKGKWLLPRRVLEDAAFIGRRDAFLMLPEVTCDVEVTWPQVDQ